ncbi:unnamed protein product [Fraxinus pennsylvanica]|uniref:Uncharacterized protein n=1 Tax=Fraxinus pennsylvanica TaxID=56036 RepID=A0AAD2DZL1_9LAMI|nr:unnamed protein product [Fraxinus pennsylvanica]
MDAECGGGAWKWRPAKTVAGVKMLLVGGYKDGGGSERQMCGENILFDDKVTILELLESSETTPSITGMQNNDNNRTIRRRPAAAVEKIPESDFNAVNEDSENIDEIINGCGGVVESEESEELINNKEVDDKKIKENGESSKGMEASVVKFSYRPSAPAHWRIKESPLSSDAIFKQVCLVFVFFNYIPLYAVHKRAAMDGRAQLTEP